MRNTCQSGNSAPIYSAKLNPR